MVKVKIQQSEPPLEKVVLARAIMDASAAMTQLLASGRNARAIRILVSAASGINQTQVKVVMECLADLAAQFTTNTRKS